jgi:FKBP-type peptidyl-prolyl cis-trans isomerase FkpA
MTTVTAVPIQPLARGALVKLWLALALLVAAAAGLAWWGTQGFQTVTLASGVRYRVVHEGNGPPMTPADVVALRYKLHVGSPDSRIIQDSDESGQPFVATIGEVFPGFGEGLQHMRAGGSYLLWLPPGTHAQGPLPPSAPFRATDTLVFELQVLQIGAGQAQAYQMQRMQQLQQQMQMQMQQQGAPGAPGAGGAHPPAGGGGAGGPPPAGH